MIIGIKEADKVVLAFSSFDWCISVSADDMADAENVGIWKVKGNPHTLMGCTFPTAESDAFRYEEEIFQGEINFDKLVEEIAPAMEEFAQDKEYIGDGNGRFAEFLIAQRGKLFEITSEHIVREINSFIVMGRDEEYAKGCLLATEGLPALERIKAAFKFCAREKQDDCYPIAVMDTKTETMQLLTRE